MTLHIALTPDAEARLRERAAAAGKDPALYAREVLEEQLATAEELLPEQEPLSVQDRVTEFLKWTESHQPTGHRLDDSRESIYAGRGE